MRVGFVASRKVGKSVERNRAKRRLRALFVEYVEELEVGGYIFVAKPSILGSEFAQLRRHFEGILRRMKSQ